MRISDWSSDVCSSDLSREGVLSCCQVRFHRAYLGSHDIAPFQRGRKEAQQARQFSRQIVHGSSRYSTANAAIGASYVAPRRCLHLVCINAHPNHSLSVPILFCCRCVATRACRTAKFSMRPCRTPTRSEEHTSELQSLMRI